MSEMIECNFLCQQYITIAEQFDFNSFLALLQPHVQDLITGSLAKDVGDLTGMVMQGRSNCGIMGLNMCSVAMKHPANFCPVGVLRIHFKKNILASVYFTEKICANKYTN